jgi:hypothetical protein
LGDRLHVLDLEEFEVLLLRADCVPSRCFLQRLEELLDFFKDGLDLLKICAQRLIGSELRVFVDRDSLILSA